MLVGNVVAEVDGLTLELVHEALVDVRSVLERNLDTRPTDCDDKRSEQVSTSVGRRWEGCMREDELQVKLIVFLQPDRAETRPPEDILKWYSPLSSLEMVTGRRFDTTIRRGAAGGKGGETLVQHLCWARLRLRGPVGLKATPEGVQAAPSRRS